MDLDQKPKLMIIDDDEISLIHYKFLVDNHGGFREVQFFSRPYMALEYLILSMDEWPDIILSNINMSKIDGWDFLDHLKVFLPEKLESCMFCMFSDTSHPYHMKLAEQKEEVSFYIPKPLDLKKVANLATSYKQFFFKLKQH